MEKIFQTLLKKLEAKFERHQRWGAHMSEEGHKRLAEVQDQKLVALIQAIIEIL